MENCLVNKHKLMHFINDETTLNIAMAMAKEASKMAYCPYSNFRVGAAIITSGGQIITGCNVENASYGLTICAERNAVFNMKVNASHDDNVVAIVIYTPTQTPSAPCGACRQVINEFNPNTRIISICDSDEVLDTTLDKLLPNSFGPHNLVKS